MRVVQMTLDDDLVVAVDEAAVALHTSRSAFTREALKTALAQMALRREEERQRRGYQRVPVQADEFGDWEGVQAWGDE
jgi:metal-responsive CopG/Arc/MetJ family transcriptional regulator